MTDIYKISKESLLLLAEYNVWATQRLLNSLKPLSDDELHRDVGLFFGSILGTLNHLLVGEHLLWYARFAQSISPKMALNAIVEQDPVQLFIELESRAQNWITFLEQLDQEKLNSQFSYQTASGEAKCLPYAATLLHVFKHATQHRGQITAALTGLGYECPELDLVYMLVEKHASFLDTE